MQVFLIVCRWLHVSNYKLEIYKEENSLIRQQQEIVTFMDNPDNPFWDKACIERRGKHIIDAALAIWDVNKI